METSLLQDDSNSVFSLTILAANQGYSDQSVLIGVQNFNSELISTRNKFQLGTKFYSEVRVRVTVRAMVFILS